MGPRAREGDERGVKRHVDKIDVIGVVQCLSNHDGFRGWRIGAYDAGEVSGGFRQFERNHGLVAVSAIQGINGLEFERAEKAGHHQHPQTGGKSEK
jgi:hypothetical protein